MKSSVLLILLACSNPVLAQSTTDPSLQALIAQTDQAAESAKAKYSTCLLNGATAMRKKNKKVAPDLLVRAARSNCRAQAALLSIAISDEAVTRVEDKVLAELLERP